MFIEDIHTEFRMLVDKTYNGSFPEIETQEIDNILNYTVYQFIHTKYGLNNIYQKGFEQSQKRIDDLRYLVKTAYFNSSNTYTENNVMYSTIDLNFPFKDMNLTNKMYNVKYLHFVKMESKITVQLFNNCEQPVNKIGFPEVKVISQEEWDKVKNDPFNKPVVNKVLATFDSTGIEIKSVPCTLNYVKLTFLKEPSKIKYVEDFDILDNTTTLEINTLYEVLTETITYNSKVYIKGDVFETNGIMSFTGTGTVRLFTGIEFPEYVIKEIVKLAVANLTEVLESPRQNTLSNFNTKIE